MTENPTATGLSEAGVGEIVHDLGSEPDTGWFIVGEGGYFDVDNGVWCDPEEGDAPWTSEHFQLFGHVRELAAHVTAAEDRMREAAVCDFVGWVATQRAYNGSDHKHGQSLYNECINGALPLWAEGYLRTVLAPTAHAAATMPEVGQ